MSYIGNEPIVSATRTVTEITATAGQTTFTANGGYTVGFIDVFVNGAQQQSTDFTATNGSTITLISPAALGDDIRLVAWGKFSVASLDGSNLVNSSVTQAKLAANVAGNGPAFSAYYSGSPQTPAANTWTKLIFNTEDYDTANCFDSTTNYRFTPNVAGYYQINLLCTVGQNGSTAATHYGSIYKNGSTYANSTSYGANGAYTNVCVSALIYMNGTTDYLEGYVQSSSQGFYPQTNNRSVAFSGTLVRAA